MRRNYLSIKDKIEVGMFIKEHCRYPEGSDYPKWDKEWSDTATTDHFKTTIPKINSLHVRHIRQELGLFLEPNRSKGKKNVTDLEQRLKALEARVESLESLLLANDLHSGRIGKLEARFHELEDKYTSPKR